MTESQRTLAFVGVAVASLGLALIAAPTGPKPPKDYQRVGEEFYPDFKDPDAAKKLEVVSYNPDTAEARVFGVEFKDGLWRIPSRHNYPADGKDRLAKCATTVIGIKRENQVGVRESEHPDFEVVDPLDQKSESLKRGQRITLKDEAGKTLADYIIGKQVPNRPGFYYLRRPDEMATYSAKVELQLSTKFADWIEPDLLKIDEFKLTGVTIDNYSVDTERGRILGREQNVLSRKNSSDPWKLDGLDEATEEVNLDEVRKLTRSLDDLKIVGVRPKPVKLQRDLRLGEGVTVDQGTAMDLGMKGFFFAQTPDGGQQLVSKEGDLIAKTDQGVEYILHFGDVFAGTEDEIEFGFAKKEGDANKDKPDDPEKKDEGDKSKSGLKKSRYLFVTVQFDPELLGPKPEEPTKPEEPGEAPPAPEPRAEDAPLDATAPDNVGPYAEYLAKKQAYDAALAKYEADKQKFETESKTYADKVEEAEKKVKELNHRFADWYYVISAEFFENLRQGRKTLVKAKSAAAAPSPPSLTPPN